METVILKIILCSGIVLGLYYLFLAKEKTFTFNRFYLLLGVIFSYSIPFVSIETKQIEKEKPIIVFEQEISQQVLQTPIVNQAETFDYTLLLGIIYFIISGILLVKMMYSVIKIKTLKGRKITYQNRNVVLLEKEIAPFSFLSSVYLSKNYYKAGKIDDIIFLHEEIHVKQKHTLDILFIEVLKAFSWFNPFIYFYKIAMITNHEFIADEEVITKNKNIKNYQELILNEVLKQQNFNLTHQFNFNNTKNRFIMMTNKNSKFAKAKRYLAIPAIAVLAVLFAERVYATDHSEHLTQEKQNVNSQIFSDDSYEKYKQILKKYSHLLDNKEYAKFEKLLIDSDREKLSELYENLTEEQKDETVLVFFKPSKFEKDTPSKVDLQNFRNLKKYQKEGSEILMGFKAEGIKTVNKDTITPKKI